MKTKFIAAIAVSLLFSLQACNQRQQIKIGLGSTEPALEISSTLATELGSDYLVSTQAYASSAELVSALKNGQVDLAIIEEPAQPLDGVQVLRAMFPSVLHVLAKPELNDPKVSNRVVADVVRGHSVFAGPPGGAGHALIQMLVQQNVFPPADEFTLLESAFEATPDIYVVFGGILSYENLQRLKGYRLVSLGSVADYGRGSWAEGVSLRAPSIQPFIIPDGMYTGFSDSATLSLSVQSLLVTNSDLSDEIAYDVLAKVDSLMARFRTIYSLAGRHQADEQEISFNLATHSGALRYQQRAAPGFLERYAELLAFVITLILALSSLLVALVRMRKQARKDRIDVYFEELLGLRDSLVGGEEPHEAIAERIVALQHKVTQLVSEERIAADTAFVGFLELSNQVLRESRPD